MDFPSYHIFCARIYEQIPSQNNLVSLKFLGKNAIVLENSDFKKKFPYLTQLIYGEQYNLQVSECAQSRYRFVMKGWNLQRSLHRIFREEIVEEIFMKIV